MCDNTQKISSTVFSQKALLAVLFFIGIVLRLKHYLENRSFWLDEAYVALQVLSQSFKEILWNMPLSSDLPTAPMGFLLVEKIFVVLLGNSECVFRLFPFLCGVVALFLFHEVLKRFVQPKVILIALGVFVFSDALIYYSAELKQYSTEVLISLGLLLMASNMLRGETFNFPTRMAYASLGICAVTFSHAALFMLASMAVTSFLFCKKREKKIALLKIFCFWLLGFLFWYNASFRHMLRNPALLKGAADHNAFVPETFFLTQGILWFAQKFFVFFRRPLCLASSWLGACLFAAGILSLWKKDKEKTTLLFLPLFFVFLANALRKYPWEPRFLLFYVPIAIIYVSEGLVFIARRSKKHARSIQCVLIILLFAHPAWMAGKNFVRGRAKEETRPLMQILKQKIKAEDTVYVNLQGAYAYLYYVGRHNILEAMHMPLGIFSDSVFPDTEKPYVAFREKKPFFSQDGYFKGYLKAYTPQKELRMEDKDVFKECSRLWVLFSHALDAEDFVCRYLNKNARKIQEFHSTGASLYLFDCSNKR